MNAALKKLIKLMPPLKNTKDTCVAWDRLEDATGVKYPTTFKEFVEVYGSSIWFDHVRLFYTTAESEADMEKYTQSLEEQVSPLQNGIYIYNKELGQREEVNFPLYPEKGGLLTFMIDFSGSYYCWNPKGRNANKWPIVCCFTSQVLIIESITVPEMFLEWIERKPRMVDLWGDIQDLPPERVRLD